MAAVDEELVVARLLHEARVDELRHQVGGRLALVRLGLQGAEVALELGDARDPRLGLRLLLRLRLLVGLDLRLRPAPLGAGLEQLRAHAPADCTKEESV